MQTARNLKPTAPKLRLVSNELELPLSWSLTDDESRFSFITLPSGAKFIHAAQVARGTSVFKLKQRLAALGGKVIIRGCSSALCDELGLSKAFQLGSAARLELDGYRPPHKVRNLARRGAKAVEIRELPVDRATAASVTPWLWSLRGEASLQFLYRTEFADAQRAFAAFAPGSTQPAGLVSLTRYGADAWHVELLCRDPHAPQGTMERLLSHVIETLQSEGAATLNLGEGGLDFTAEVAGLGWLNRLVLLLAPFMTRVFNGRYDVEGLHRFKSKFEPTWEPRFFSGASALDLIAMAKVTGITQMIKR